LQAEGVADSITEQMLASRDVVPGGFIDGDEGGGGSFFAPPLRLRLR